MSRTFNNFAMLLIGAALFAGCQETHEAAPTRTITLPDNAKQVAEGPGQLSFRAPDDGRIFVYDVDEATVLAAPHVRAGQQVVVSPDSNAAMLDGRKLLEKTLKTGHTNRLYFEPE